MSAPKPWERTKTALNTAASPESIIAPSLSMPDPITTANRSISSPITNSTTMQGPTSMGSV